MENEATPISAGEAVDWLGTIVDGGDRSQAAVAQSVINLIDENNFLVSYPEMPDGAERKKSKMKFSEAALAVSKID